MSPPHTRFTVTFNTHVRKGTERISSKHLLSKLGFILQVCASFTPAHTEVDFGFLAGHLLTILSAKSAFKRRGRASEVRV